MEAPEEWPSNPQGGTEPGLQALWLFSFCDKKMPGREPPGGNGCFFRTFCRLLLCCATFPTQPARSGFFQRRLLSPALLSVPGPVRGPRSSRQNKGSSPDKGPRSGPARSSECSSCLTSPTRDAFCFVVEKICSTQRYWNQYFSCKNNALIDFPNLGKEKAPVLNMKRTGWRPPVFTEYSNIIIKLFCKTQ